MNLTFKAGRDKKVRLRMRFDDDTCYEIDVELNYPPVTTPIIGRNWNEVVDFEILRQSSTAWEKIPITPMLLNGGELFLDKRSYWDQKLRDLALMETQNGED